MRRDPRLLAVLAVLAVVGLVVGVSIAAPKARPAKVAGPQVSPIEQTSLVCPQVGGAPKGDASRLALAAPVDAAGSALTTSALAAGSTPSAVPLSPGNALVVDGGADAGPLRLDVAGPLATSLGALQFSRTVTGSVWQSAASSCDQPTTDAWFAGFSSQVGAHETLYLSNIDRLAATVSVTVWGDTSAPFTRAGIAVAPQSQVSIALDSLDPDLTIEAARVQSTIGRVVPALRYDAENGTVPLGADWVPRTDAPATTQVVPGIPSGTGARRFVIADPGDVDATVSLKVVTGTQGSFTPTAFDSIDVPAGGVLAENLDTVLAGAAAAIVATSTVPIITGALSFSPPDPSGASDLAFSAAVPALGGEAVAAGGEQSSQRQTQLIVSAPGADAVVSLTQLPAALTATPVHDDVGVPGGSTTVIDLASLGADVAPGVAVERVSGGPVYVAWVLTENGDTKAAKTTTDITEIPLRSAVRATSTPPVRSDLTVGLN